jgi:hypothetical protein
MPYSLKTVFLCFVALVFTLLGLFWFSPLRAKGTYSQEHISTLITPTPRPTVIKSHLPENAQANGPYKVQGNVILGADGKRYLFHGIGRDSLEYSCWGDGHFDARELSYLGRGTNTKTITYWGANTVRLPLSEDIWLHGQSSESCLASHYRSLVKQTVDTLTTLRLNVVLICIGPMLEENHYKAEGHGQCQMQKV